MVRKVFGHSELKYAGYVMALVSAITTTLMLSNPNDFLNLAFSAGILPMIMMILFAGFCLIPLGAFIIMLFVGLKERFGLHTITNHFDHEIPEPEIDVHWVPEAPHGGDDLGISEVGRQQIARLVRAQKKEDEKEKESGYIFISSEDGSE
jgi:hypothetical protein